MYRHASEDWHPVKTIKHLLFKELYEDWIPAFAGMTVKNGLSRVVFYSVFFTGMKIL